MHPAQQRFRSKISYVGLYRSSGLWSVIECKLLVQYAAPARHCKQSVYVQPVRLSARRPLAAPAALAGAQVPDPRLRRLGPRHRELLVTSLTLRLPEGQQAQEQAKRWTGLRATEVSLTFGLIFVWWCWVLNLDLILVINS